MSTGSGNALIEVAATNMVSFSVRLSRLVHLHVVRHGGHDLSCASRSSQPRRAMGWGLAWGGFGCGLAQCHAQCVCDVALAPGPRAIRSTTYCLTLPHEPDPHFHTTNYVLPPYYLRTQSNCQSRPRALTTVGIAGLELGRVVEYTRIGLKDLRGNRYRQVERLPTPRHPPAAATP